MSQRSYYLFIGYCDKHDWRLIMNVTFIGVGAIGLPMAIQIKNAGHCVTGVDFSEQSRQKAKEFDIDVVKEFNAAPHAEVVIVMVATGQQLMSLVSTLGPEVNGQIWIIMSTVGPECIIDASNILSDYGAVVIDAPVTGGTARAKTGQLMIFASGEKDIIDYASNILSAMGTVKFISEQVGKGQSVKVINQHLCSVHIVAAAEALNLTEKLGLDPHTVLPLIEVGAAGSWMLTDRGPRMLEGTDVEVCSSINIFVKDSSLVLSSANNAGIDVPLLALSHERYLKAAEAGLGNKDDSRVIETWN